MGGSAGYTIFSSDTKRQYYKTPLDTFEKININNLKNPMQFTLGTIVLLDAEPDLSLYGDFLKPERIIGTASARYGLSMVRGQVVEYNYTTGWYTPVPNAILHVTRTFPGDPLGSQILYPVDFFVRSDENGYFRIVGETPFSLREANAPGGGTSLPGPYVHAYVINSSGAIVYANDMGKYGAQRYPPLALMDREEVFLQVVVFKCSSMVLYNCIEPDKVKPAVGLRFAVNDIRSHSEPESYGVTFNPYFYNGHVAIIFVPPKTPIEVIMYYSYQEQPLTTLINASSSNPTGIGYMLNEGECISFTSYNYAKDFYWLTYHYVDKAASNFINNNFVWRLNTANEYLLEAKSALINNTYSVFWDYSIKAWLEVWRLYKNVKSALRDAGRAFVLFCFILLPSVILMERLIQFSTGNKRLLFVLTVVAVIFALSYFIHPGLRIVPNPLMTAIGVAILSLTIPLIYIIIIKLVSLLKGYRLETAGKHFTETGRGQAMWLALNIGCGHAKKRPIRMILNLTLMVIVTASLVSLASFSSEATVKPTIVFTGQTNYPGILVISEIGSDPIQSQIVEALRIEYGNEAIIAPRAYGWSGSAGSSLAAWKIFWNIECEGRQDNRSVLTVLGLTPEESMVSGIDKALIDGIWFTETSDYACIISDRTAQRLGIFNLTQPVHIKWEGMNYTVIGIFDSNLVNGLLDLDQNRLVPPDIWSSPYQGVSVVRVDSANTMFIPYKNALSLGFQVYSVGLAFHEKSFQEIEEKAIEILKRFRRLTYVGKDDYIALYSERSFASFTGFQYQLVPIFIGALSMMNMLFASVQERSKEIFTLSAVGLSPIQVAFLFLAEALIFAFVGALIGYVIGVAISYFNMVIGVHQGFYINYGSTATFLAIFIVVIFVLVSVIYPLIKASKIVTPSMERKWTPSSKPKGDEWEVALPFTASSIQNALGVINYLEEYFRSQMHPEAEDFRVVDVEKKKESNRVLLKAIIRLKPYEQGIIQEAAIEGKRPAGLNRFVFNTYVKRKQGPRSIWESSNLVFFECIRRQFLYWQSLKEEEQTRYMH
jgi:ABC-type antimicrobial peptide transport system permease subunit